MQQIGDELQESTGAVAQRSFRVDGIKILDLCMAPGGYTASALKYNPGAAAFGITLPSQHGGHEMLLPPSRSTVYFMDITMLAQEFGVETIPQAHPEVDSFVTERPFLESKFEMVFCDGQVLRTHPRGKHRESNEALRLTVSQLILALQRIREGGTLIMLLHKVEAWDTAELLYRFSQFSSIQLFKPKKKHAIRSSFYLIARDVQPSAPSARLAVESWKAAWYDATFGGENGTGGPKATVDETEVKALIDRFGNRLAELGRPIWEIQRSALRKTDFVK